MIATFQMSSFVFSLCQLKDCLLSWNKTGWNIDISIYNLTVEPVFVRSEFWLWKCSFGPIRFNLKFSLQTIAGAWLWQRFEEKIAGDSSSVQKVLVLTATAMVLSFNKESQRAFLSDGNDFTEY